MSEYLDRSKLLMNISDNEFTNAAADGHGNEAEFEFWHRVWGYIEGFPAAEIPNQTEARPPVWKEGEGVIHYDHVDGSSHTEVNRWAQWVCPVCGWFVGEQYVPRKHNQRKSNFCSECGQKIDWKAVDNHDRT